MRFGRLLKRLIAQRSDLPPRYLTAGLLPIGATATFLLLRRVPTDAEQAAG